MKIAFDAKRITHNSTGLGNYSRYIVNGLAQYFPSNNYLLFSPQKGNKKLTMQVSNSPAITYHFPKTNRPFFRQYWRSFGIISDLKKELPDLFHGLSNELPVGLSKAGIPAIVTIHDLIFIRYPQFYNWIDRHIYTYKFRKACQQANRIIAISEMTKRDIVSFFHIPEEKIDVVYQGCDASFIKEESPEKKEKVKAKYNLPKQYILSVGSIESRKNLLLIVKALKYTHTDIPLIAIGKRTDYTPEVEKYCIENGLQERVTILNNIPFDELPAFYRQASLFIYPSFFEGFGIPIIEALHSDVPVIAATGSCLEEAGGPGTIYIDPTNERQLAEQINSVLEDPALADSMRKQGKEYVKRFLDEQIAHNIMQVYQKVSPFRK